MAIQMRRGPLANYDKDKMVAGELAVTTDATTENQQVYVAFAPGTSKRILTETDLDSPALTGTPTAPTAAEGTNSTQIATTEFVQNAIEGISSGGTGLTEEIKQALLQLAQKVAYIDEHGQDYYDDLYDALYQQYTVTNNLTDVTNSNSATSATGGSSYTATLTAESGYITMLSITMGGRDITSQVWTPAT